jgi:N-dimethylarginine dimethylaminohydrolase
MTVLDIRLSPRPARQARTRHYVMCPPTHFAVTYAINPWMDASVPVDAERATVQWDVLRHAYLALGHRVEIVTPDPGQPDMVFAANGGLTVGGRTYGARFRHPERQAEAAAFTTFLREAGHDVVDPVHTNEGEGDFLVLGSMILAGTGFRTSLEAHVEAAEVLDRPVVSLELVDPRFYHLDTALAVLDSTPGQEHIAYLPSAFDAPSLALLQERYPDAIIVNETDAAILGLNSYSDGLNVVIASRAKDFERQLIEHGYNPIGVDLSELLLGGGGVKCCTLELRR